MYTAYNAKMEDILPKLKTESVDVILSDPPYLYLKNQKLDRMFDETLFFTEAKRVLKKNGFIILFGRGTSFYRWNTILADLNFTFKEEIIWNKSYVTSPLMAISRVHETISIHCNGKKGINKVKVPYLEIKKHDLQSIIQDVKRIRTILKNPESLKAVQKYLENSTLKYDLNITNKNLIVNSLDVKNSDRCVCALRAIDKGMNEKSVIDCKNDNVLSVTISSAINQQNRVVSALNAMSEGMNEKSIIKNLRDHRSAIHPTQKPVRLLERLLALVVPKDVKRPVVLDPFAGSFSSGEAAINMGCHPILIELDAKYFHASRQRLENHINKNNP